MWTTVPPAKSNVGMPPVREAFEQAVFAPHHVGHGRIHEQRPQQGKQGHRAELHPFGKRAGDERRSDDGKHQLIDHERGQGNGGRVGRVGRRADSAQKQMMKSADKPVPEPKHKLKPTKAHTTVMMPVIAKLCIMVLKTFFFRTRPP